MDFRLLGPIEIADRDVRVQPGGPRQRALLALLLLRRNEVCSSDLLLEELWADEASERANALQAAVSRLRRTPLGDRLGTRAPGYLLRVEPGELDVERFEVLLGRGREALAAGDRAAAAELLREGIGLWRGPALCDFVYEPFAQSEIARLEELHLACLEERVEADLALGHDEELVPELETVVKEHPLRERPRGQLMLALYRAGRQAEALELYRDTREMLLDELGLEPGPPLRALEQAILRQDSSLARPTRVAVPLAGPEPAGGSAPALPAGEDVRKTVTVVFADFADSTGLAERLDPEALRTVLRRYFEVGSKAVTRHGGLAATFVGDVLMAVFGVPELHEDDALRAVRAAHDLCGDVATLDTELERDLGIRLRVRVGISTGEVVVGDAAEGLALVSGEPVISAARLEQIAAPGEVLLAEATLRLVAAAVDVAPLPPRELKGKQDPVAAWRLIDVRGDAPAFSRRLDAALVGRDIELVQLRASFDRAVRERGLQLVTLHGPAGIGKTRLALEVTTVLGADATVVHGRCLPYGEGITFWPLRELVGGVSTAERAELVELLGGEADPEWVVDRVLAAIGLNETVTETDEIFVATRKLLDAMAQTRPLVVVLEDLHWAEPTFLELIEHLVDFSTDAPILLLCIGRSDLLDMRPTWGGGKRNATFLELAPLTELEAEELLDNLAGVPLVSPAKRAKVKEAAEGNPLFLEQLAAMLGNEAAAASDVPLPPTIEALLAARIERLGPGERAVLECVAVVGRETSLRAAEELLPEQGRQSAARHLQELARMHFLRQARTTVGGEDAFRFRHILIQEAVYRGIPKARRADLHEQYAAWVDETPGRSAAETDELVGYHLEQAHRFLRELGAGGERTDALAGRAARHLAAAGHRASIRGDTAAVANLLSRAVALLGPDEPERLELLPELGAALREMSDLAGAEAVLDEASKAAASADTLQIEARARVARSLLRFHTEPGALTEALDEARWAVTALEQARDELGLARAWHLLAFVQWWRGEATAAQQGWERSIACARAAGAQREERSGLAWLSRVALRGPMPGREAAARCDEILKQVEGDRKAEALALISVSGVRALEGHFDEARALAARARTTYEELGLQSNAAWASHAAGFVELLARDAAAAERELRPSYEALVRLGVRGGLPTLGALLAEAIYEQARFAEAEQLALTIEALQPEAVTVRAVRAKAVARLGRLAAAEELARETVEAVEQTEFTLDRAEAAMSLGEVLGVVGRIDEAAKAIERAVALYQQKGSEVAATRAAVLSAASPTAAT
jgi:class 3 adenylate cyclase